MDALKQKAKYFIFVLMLGVLISPFSQAVAGDVISETRASEFIETLAIEASPILAISGDTQSRRDYFEKFVRDHFALDRIAAFALGRHWRQLDEGQQQRYLKLFKTYVIAVNASRITQFGAVKVNVISSQQVGRYDQMVLSHWQEAKQVQPVPVEWRVRLIDGVPKILDVRISGLSMAQVQREEFQSVLNRDGFESLLQKIQDQLDKMASPA